MNQLHETSPRTMARITGVLYLVTLVTAAIAQAGIGNRLISLGNATTTAQNILANESLYRLGFTTYMIEMSAQIAMTALFYELLKPVNRSIALLSAVFGYVGCGVKIFSRLFYYAPLFVLGGGAIFSGFSESQLASVSLFMLKINDYGAGLALAFFGFSVLLKGWLIIKSTFLPHWLGVLALVAGIGWVSFLSPELGLRLFPYIAAIGLVGSLATIVWLLVKGVDEERWKEQAAVAAGSMWR